MSDLNDIITESIEDVSTPAEPMEVAGGAEVTAAPEVHAPDTAPLEGAEPEVAPAVHAPMDKDEFEAKWGIPPQTINGRENRIPYSRVKKINFNTEKELAELALGRKFTKEELEKKGFKASDFVKSHVAKLPELEAKVKDYEERFERVNRFENIMVNEPEKFVNMLATLPAYKPFFDAIEKAFQIIQTGQAPQQHQVRQNPTDAMPEPDEVLPDGSRVYSMEGLARRDAWNRAQAKNEILKEVEAKYGPIQQEYETQKTWNQASQAVHNQIQEARTWELFQEHEDAIAEVLQKNPKWSLERAYNHVVLPKYKADRIKMRQELLAELEKAPKATSAPAGAVKSLPVEGPPKSLNDVIRESIKGLK